MYVCKVRERERENHHTQARGAMHTTRMCSGCAYGWIMCVRVPMCRRCTRWKGEGGQVGTLPGDGSCLPPREFIVLRSRALLPCACTDPASHPSSTSFGFSARASERASERANVSGDPAPWIHSSR